MSPWLIPLIVAVGALAFDFFLHAARMEQLAQLRADLDGIKEELEKLK